MKTTLFIASSLSLIHQSHAWGAMGHAAVAYIAQSYLTPLASTFTSHYLNGSTLAGISSWADTYRYQAGGEFSQVFHYVDALDNPPHKCGVKFDRDCPPEGCIISALANYTTRILDESLPDSERIIALNFIVHFTGDIAQPLHTENLAVGGNEISVFWGTNATTGTPIKTNLHAVWDRNIPETLAGGSTLPVAEKFAKGIVDDINGGIYKDKVAEWTSCHSIKRGTGCPKAWAQEANSHVCSAVLQDGVESVSGKDLSGDYYIKNAPVAREQLAKAGYRLGQWLNAIAKADSLRD